MYDICFKGCFVGGGINSYECGLLDLNKLGHPIFECNSTCQCEPSRCSNRVVQNGPNPHLEVIILLFILSYYKLYRTKIDI